jgi:hypothetical protein
LSGNNCLGCAAGSDLQKWAAAEKFQPSSKSSGHLNGTGQKVHSLVDSEKPSNQSSAIIVKSYTSRLPACNPDGTIIIRTDQYNRDDLRTDYTYAKFFVIKSIGEADVHKSIKYGVWSSSSNGNSKLDSAFRDADRISRRHSTKCPVFLFFSVSIDLLNIYILYRARSSTIEFFIMFIRSMVVGTSVAWLRWLDLLIFTRTWTSGVRINGPDAFL